MSFTPPEELNPEAIADLPQKPAVYRVLPLKGVWENGIPRFLGIDKERVLFYGETGRLRGRLGKLLKSMEQIEDHSEGNLIHILNREIHGFEMEGVTFSYDLQETKEEAEDMEEYLVKKYLQRFGEVPPVNTAIPKRYGDWP